MDDRFIRIEDKLDAINDKISSIDVTLVKQQVILDEHIRRTTLLEDRVSPLEENIGLYVVGIKILIFVSIIATIIDVVYRLWKGV